MLTKEQIIKQLRDHKHELHERFPVKRFALFGSYARGKQTPERDIDVLVEFNQPAGFELIDLKDDLERILNHRVDLASKGGIKPHYLPNIEEDAIYV